MGKKDEITNSLNISTSQKTYYYYKNYRYEYLKDAINHVEQENELTEKKDGAVKKT